MPGTRPSVSRSMRWIVGPASVGRRCTLAVVRTDSAGCPCSAITLASAIEKHAACAAAISSSGLVPSPSSKRDANEYAPLKTPSPTVRSPSPPLRSPRHSALPLRVAISRSCLSFEVRLLKLSRSIDQARRHAPNGHSPQDDGEDDQVCQPERIRRLEAEAGVPHQLHQLV